MISFFSSLPLFILFLFFLFSFFALFLSSCRGSRTKVSGRVSAAVDTLGEREGGWEVREDGSAINIDHERSENVERS